MTMISKIKTSPRGKPSRSKPLNGKAPRGKANGRPHAKTGASGNRTKLGAKLPLAKAAVRKPAPIKPGAVKADIHAPAHTATHTATHKIAGGKAVVAPKVADIKVADIKVADTKLAGPKVAAARPSAARVIAEFGRVPEMKSAAARIAAAMARPVLKPVFRPTGPASFSTGDYVVYPTHGVGRVTGIERRALGGAELSLLVVDFEKDRMTLRVPVNKVDTSGMRRLSSREKMRSAMTVLKGRARVKRTMWSRRAQEYEAKINSGDPESIAEVVRDLHGRVGQPDQSYSERQLYEAALDRLVRELAAVERIEPVKAVEHVNRQLKIA